jgi:predicted RNase H-like HicB family nuclease
MGSSRDVTVRVRFEDGSYWATIDEYPGLFAAGDTESELLESLVEGLRCYLGGDGAEPLVELLDAPGIEQVSAVRTLRKTLVTA